MKTTNEGALITGAFQRDFGTFITQVSTHFSQLIKDSVYSAMKETSSTARCNCQETSETAPDFITKSRALEILKISAPTLLRYQKEGIIPYYRVGRKVYFKMSEIATATRITLKTKNTRKEAKNDR